ncbi:STAS domain-containing protein [Streptomyces melanogenes]|uniref:STAS domain-containing protein n=1 Tax=Streptomyces melanogenes TaxID=67326 RepID=UPI00378D5463
MTDNPTRSTPYRARCVIGGATVVTLQGEIDILTAPRLTAHLDALTADPHPDLLLDLRPVTFIDCAGLSVLCRARNRARGRHGRLRLVTDSALFLRVLHCTGLTGFFDLHPAWPEDLADASGTNHAAPADESAGAPLAPRPMRSAKTRGPLPGAE